MPAAKTKGYIALAVTSVVWGTTWVASKVGVREVPAVQMAAIRQCIGGLCFIIFFTAVKKMPLPSLQQFKWIAVLALLMFVGANGLSTWSLNYISTGFSALIGALYPLTVVLIEIIFYKKKNTGALTFLGMLMGLGGVMVIFFENAFHIPSPHLGYGILLSFVAMLCWSFGTVFIAKNISDSYRIKMNPYYSLGWQMIVGALLLFIMARCTGKTVELTSISVKGWLMIAYLVVGGSIIAFIAFVYSMKVLPVTISSLYAYINPLVTMVVAWFVVDEKLTLNILWGAVLTIAGVFLVNYSVKYKDREAVDDIPSTSG